MQPVAWSTSVPAGIILLRERCWVVTRSPDAASSRTACTVSVILLAYSLHDPYTRMKMRSSVYYQAYGDDCFGVSQQYHQYGYSNPVSNTDPSGRCVDADADGRCDRASGGNGGILPPVLGFSPGSWSPPPGYVIPIEVIPPAVGIPVAVGGAAAAESVAVGAAVAPAAVVVGACVIVGAVLIGGAYWYLNEYPPVAPPYDYHPTPYRQPQPTPTDVPQTMPRTQPRPQPSPADPTAAPTPRNGHTISVYRGLDGDPSKDKTYFKGAKYSPSQYRVNADGVSMFELYALPGNKPYAVQFDIELHQPRTLGATGLVSGLPGCSGTYTPEHGGEGHWSINCLAGTQDALASYGHTRGAIPNPNWTGLPQERR